MSVLGFVARRVAWTGVLMLGICLVTFVIFFIVPQSRSNFVFRTESNANDVPRATGIQGPVPEQFAIFLKKVFFEGSLGRSFGSRREVADILGDAVPATGSLVLGGAILWLLIAFPLGVLSALRPRSLLDRAGTIFVLVGLSAHPIALGLGLSWLLGFHWHVLPITGYADFFAPSTAYGGPVQWAYHLILPWVTFAMLFAALYVRMIRATVMEELHADYVTTARAKGASSYGVVRNHILPNALIPVLTMVGMDVVPKALFSIVFVERAFEIPGIGGILVQSASRNDLPVIMGITLLVAFAICILNLTVDIACALLDPRTHGGWRRHAKRVEPATTAAPAPAPQPAASTTSG